MPEKLNTTASADAQTAWASAKTPEEKKSAVNKFEELRHLFHEAWEIWNNLPDEPAKPAATTNPPK